MLQWRISICVPPMFFFYIDDTPFDLGEQKRMIDVWIPYSSFSLKVLVLLILAITLSWLWHWNRTQSLVIFIKKKKKKNTCAILTVSQVKLSGRKNTYSIYSFIYGRMMTMCTPGTQTIKRLLDITSNYTIALLKGNLTACAEKREAYHHSIIQCVDIHFDPLLGFKQATLPF